MKKVRREVAVKLPVAAESPHPIATRARSSSLQRKVPAQRATRVIRAKKNIKIMSTNLRRVVHRRLRRLQATTNRPRLTGLYYFIMSICISLNFINVAFLCKRFQ